MLINAGIKRVVFEEAYPDDLSLTMLHDAGVVLDIWRQPGI